MTPDQVQPKNDPSIEKGSPDEVASLATGTDLRVVQQVVDALAAIPGGEQLDSYFGISSRLPEQRPEEAAQSDELITRLRGATQGSSVDLTQLLGDIERHTASSGADPEALRALMRRSKRPTDPNEGHGG